MELSRCVKWSHGHPKCTNIDCVAQCHRYRNEGVFQSKGVIRTYIINNFFKQYYPFLDGFRGIAILFILLRHARDAFHLSDIFSQHAPILEWVYFTALHKLNFDLTRVYEFIQFMLNKVKGVIGVEIFLVLSGFLITRGLLARDFSKFSFRDFYWKRFLRIYPVYFLLVVVSTILFFPKFYSYHVSIAEIFKGTLPYLVLMQNYFSQFNPFLAHTWTLVIFEQFYVFCPIIIFLVYRYVRNPHKRLNLLIIIAIAMLIIPPVIRCFYVESGYIFIQWPLAAPTPNQTTLYRGDALAFGALMALLEPYWSRLPKNKWLGVLAWIMGMGLYVFLFLDDHWGNYHGEWYLFTLGYIAFGLLIIAAHQGVTLLARFKSLQWIGKQSYGVYIWHYILLAVWGPWVGTIPIDLVVLGYLSSSILLGSLSTRFIEGYFLSFLKKT